MATNDDAAMSAAVKAASDEVLQAAAAVTKACNALDPADGAKWAKRLDRVLDAVDAYAGAPPKGAPASSAVDATAGRALRRHRKRAGGPRPNQDIRNVKLETPRIPGRRRRRPRPRVVPSQPLIPFFLRHVDPRRLRPPNIA